MFLDKKTGKEISVAHSRREPAKRIKDADLPEAYKNMHSLWIGGATAYENSTAAGAS